MLDQPCLTDWHQIFLVAAGFLSAILLVWSRFWVQSFYDEQAYDRRPAADRRFSTHIGRLWLSFGLLFALLAFGFTVLDWLLTRQLVQLYIAAYQIPMERLAAGFLMGAFDITLIAIIQQIHNVWETSMKKGEPKPIDYGRHLHERTRSKTCLFRATYVALSIIFVFCLLQAFVPLSPTWWFWLALGSFLIPGLILLVTYMHISRRRGSLDHIAF